MDFVVKMLLLYSYEGHDQKKTDNVHVDMVIFSAVM